MTYTVKPGDTLWRIARRELGSSARWREIAVLNRLSAPHMLLVGQRLMLPDRGLLRPTMLPRAPHGLSPRQPVGYLADVTPEIGRDWDTARGATTMPGRAFLFVLADEVLPSGKLVRKVLAVPPRLQADVIAANPEVYGIKPQAPGARVSLGEHALGNNKSPYISASTKPGGAPTMQGRPVYIDIKKATAAGVTVHSTEEIIRDLDRLAAENPHMQPRIEKLKAVIGKVEGEVLLEGNVPATAVKSKVAMRLTHGLRFVQVVGMVVTVYDVGNAAVKSFEHESAAPLVAEGIRQIGGWGGAIAGAKLGAISGALVGIETGPGAIITGAIGAIIFGAAGYFGADWIADKIDAN